MPQKNSRFLSKNGYSFGENIVPIWGVKPYPFLNQTVLLFSDISGSNFMGGLCILQLLKQAISIC